MLGRCPGSPRSAPRSASPTGAPGPTPPRTPSRPSAWPCASAPPAWRATCGSPPTAWPCSTTTASSGAASAARAIAERRPGRAARAHPDPRRALRGVRHRPRALARREGPGRRRRGDRGGRRAAGAEARRLWLCHPDLEVVAPWREPLRRRAAWSTRPGWAASTRGPERHAAAAARGRHRRGQPPPHRVDAAASCRSSTASRCWPSAGTPSTTASSTTCSTWASTRSTATTSTAWSPPSSGLG